MSRIVVVSGLGAPLGPRLGGPNDGRCLAFFGILNFERSESRRPPSDRVPPSVRRAEASEASPAAIRTVLYTLTPDRPPLWRPFTGTYAFSSFQPKKN